MGRRRGIFFYIPLLLLLSVCGGGVWGAAAPYFGSEVGELSSRSHGVRGSVHAVDHRTLFVKGFSYDGQGNDAFLWAGTGSGPDETGFIIPDEKGNRKKPLREYRSEDLLLRLPPGKTLPDDIRWIAVWGRGDKADYGSVKVASDLAVPRPAVLGSLRSDKGGVSSGRVTVVDTHTLLLPEFTFTGGKAAAHFWVSRGSRQHPRGIRVPDENGSLSPLGTYSGKTLVLSLPVSVHEVDWFGVWDGKEDLGSVKIPSSPLLVPPSPRTLGVQIEYKLNCEVLRDQDGFEMRWIMDGEDIVMQMVARLGAREHMSFGLSKNDSSSSFAGADLVVAWMDKGGKGHAEDQYVSADTKERQCRAGCPDVDLPGGTDSVELLNAAKVNGYTMVTVKRPQIGTDDKYDQHVYSDGPQAVVWEIGPSAGATRAEGDVFIDFARSPAWNCPQPAEPQKGEEEERSVEEWTVPPLACPADRTLRVQVGPPHPSGGVGVEWAWYVNGLLQPELTLERGRSYTFVVEGGETRPFYITDDPEGGIGLKDTKKKQKIYAGVHEDRSGKLTPTGKGRMCEWKSGREKSFASFAAFREQLQLTCEKGKAGRITFRPDSRTPDTLYYQSFTHRHLGGQIHVVDSCEGRLHHEASVQHVSNVTFNSLNGHYHKGVATHGNTPSSAGNATSLAGDYKRGGVDSPVVAAEKRRYFFTTTPTPKPHPVTMEAFHLSDVVHPYNQRYNSGHRKQLSELKDTLHWWNSPQAPTGQQRHTGAVVSIRSKDLKHRQTEPQRHPAPPRLADTQDSSVSLKSQATQQRPRTATKQQQHRSATKQQNRPRSATKQHRTATEQQHRVATEQQYRVATEQHHRTATKQQNRPATEQHHHVATEQQNRPATKKHRTATEQQHRATSSNRNIVPSNNMRDHFVASASNSRQQNMVPVLLLGNDKLVVSRESAAHVMSLLRGSRVKRSHDHHHDKDKDKKKKKKKSGAGHPAAPWWPLLALFAVLLAH